MNNEFLTQEQDPAPQKKRKGRLIASIILLVLAVVAFMFYCIFFSAVSSFLASADAAEGGEEALGFAIALIAVLPVLLAIVILCGLLVLALDIAGLIVTVKLFRNQPRARKIYAIIATSLFALTMIAAVVLFALIFVLH